jgi:hypothetical protein
MTDCALVLLSFVALAVLPVQVVAQPIPPEVFKRLIDGAKESHSKYDQVHIVADVEETVAGETHNHPYDFFKDGDAIKITNVVARGNRKEIVTDVASPKLTFRLRKPLGAKQFALSSIDRNGADYKSARELADSASFILQLPCNCFGLPIARFLAMKETSITGFRLEEKGAAKLCRLEVHVSRWRDQAPYDYLDGWLLLEMEPHMVVRDFDLKAWKNKDFLGEFKGALVYAEQEKIAPKLDMVHFEIHGKDGKIGRAYDAKVRSLTFGPVDPEQFTLPGSGFDEDKPATRRAQVNPVLLWSTVTMVLAISILVALRWRRGTGSSPAE